ncbi:MAG: ATP-grasp domain-containing protein [Bryobacterales bacterium]|nr:ATP-grasp domain-containing protein [Bryobacterales bacterium]
MSAKKRIVLFAATTGYQVRVFADVAQRLGFDLTLATDRCHVLDDPWGDHAVAVRFDKPGPSLKALQGPFDGVVAVGDRPTLLAAAAAERFGVRYHPVRAVEAASDKFLARERFRAAGLRLPSYCRIPLSGDAAAASASTSYPCVLKPLGLSASRGVIRADSPEQFVAAFERIRSILEQPDIVRRRAAQDQFLQVESYIPGSEYALEGLVTKGRLQTLALFDKPDPLDGPFFEETIYITPSREPGPVQNELIETAARAVEALGLTDGPVHAEMRHNDRGAWILEVAARPIGGLCAKALRFRGGMGLEELVLRHSVGEDVSGVALSEEASGVMMIPIPREGIYESVSGVEEAQAVAGVEDVIITAKEGQKLLPLPEGSSYLGFLFARAASPEAVETALRQSHARLEFQLATTLPVLRAPAARGR